MTLKLILTSAALAATAFAASAASAGDDIRFRYSPHELETAAGANALLTRIERSAERACNTSGIRSLYAKATEDGCAASLAESIIADIGDARLQQRWAAAQRGSAAAGK